MKPSFPLSLVVVFACLGACLAKRVNRLRYPLLRESCGLLLLVLATVSVRGAGLQTLQGHVPPAAKTLTQTGRLPAGQQLNLAIALPLRNATTLSNLLQQIYDPASPSYHHYLTPAEFTEQFGPAGQDYQAIIAFANANHLQVTATHPNRMLLDVSGTVADVERALHITLHTYQHPTEHRLFYAPDAEPSLNLGVPILHISGLDNYALPRPHLQAARIVPKQNALPNAGSGPNGTYMGKDFRAVYVPDSTLNGSGQVVGLLQFDGYTAGDITYYENKAGLQNVPLQNVLLDGFNGNPTGSGGEVEVSLDIETTISMATNLSKVIVYEAGPSGSWHDILNRMANDNLAKQLSCSWYIPNGGADTVADQIFQQMAAQGQSFFNASGDSDAYTGLISFPGDTPYITQVGGTTLTTTGPGGTWASETVWNWGVEYGRDGVGSSGGISTQYPIPTWQTNISMTANQGSTTKRNTPDVALTGDNVYVRADGSDYNVGGTSCAAPLWAGFAALVNQQAAGTGQPTIGFINPAVDAIGSGANYTTAFHDITTGNNTWSGSPNKFYAVTGYDLCTGWGTPVGQNLINALANPEALVIKPVTGFTAVGGVGGPFFPVTSQNYSLTNIGTNTLTWTLSNTSAWLTVSSTGGILNSGGPAATVTVSLNNTASNLVVGTYGATILFTNQNDNIGQGRQFTLSVIAPPNITQQPTNQAVLEGATATFNVHATGGLPLVYQWQFNGTNLTDGGNISGWATTSLTITDVSTANVGAYTVVVTNFAGMLTSSNAALTIVPSPPVITMQPANQSAALGGTAQFTVGVIGTTPFSYQWSFNGTNIDGETNVTLTLTNVQFAQAGTYSVAVSNIYGGTNSSMATLTVYPPPTVLFFDDFNGPDLNPIWQASLPDAYSGSFPGGSAQIASYIGAPNYEFEMVDTNSVLRMTNIMGPLQRRGWSSTTNFYAGDFRYELRYNTLIQSPSNSIDGFIEIWIMDAANSNRYDIISPFGGGYDSDPYFFMGSSIDGSYTRASFSYQNNTWYRLVLEAEPGQNIRGSIYDDNGTELIGHTFAHDASAYGSGFKIVISQVVGSAGAAYPVDVAVDYVKLTTGFAPTITAQPTNQVVASGGTASFEVAANGTAPLSYQWTFNGADISEATNATFIMTNVQVSQSGNYAVQITNTYGSIISSNAMLVVGFEPTIITQPTNQTVMAGTTANFTVTAAGTSPLSYQWQFNGTNVAGATNSSLSLPNVQFVQSGNYTVLVTNIFGSVLSSNALLTVLSAPVIISQPTNQSVAVGGVATMTAVAVGTPPLFYQWTFNTTNIAGATNSTLTLTNVQFAQAGNYALSVSNIYGSTLSSNAMLTVYPVSPFIMIQPTNQFVAVGGMATFTVAAGGTPPLSYQWNFNNTNIPAATNASLTLTDIQYAQAGNYAVTVTSPYGTTNSAIAVLTVSSPLATYFFDDFNGPNLNPIWQSNLPNAYCGSAGGQIAPYIGTAGYHFEILGTNTVLHMTNFMGPLQRRGWSSATNFLGTNFYYDVRYNTLIQSSTSSIDGFIEIWIMDAANSNRYDIISPFGGNYSSSPYFFMGSSIDGSYTTASISDQNNTWYHLVLQCAPGQNIRGSIYDDNGTELIGHTFAHSASAYNSGFKIVISQTVGSAGAAYPVNVALDYAKVTGFPPTIVAQPTNQTVAAGNTASFSVVAGGVSPLSYQWNFNGTNISGATNATLVLTNVQPSQAGNYAVQVTNLYGSAVSSNATLTVVDILDHFAWNPVSSPRFVKAPFSVTVQAMDPANQLFTNFTSVVLLATTNGVPVNPPGSGYFVQGAWTGSISIPQAASNLVLKAYDGAGGHVGLANPINVVGKPSLQTAQSGGFLLMFWPMDPSGFSLEYSTNLASPQWSPVIAPPLQVGNQWLESVQISYTNPVYLYRLRYTLPY